MKNNILAGKKKGFFWNNTFFARNLLGMGTVSFVLFCLLLGQPSKGKGADSNDSCDVLLDQYVQTKGSNIISFDAKNIKQFWIDNSVISQKDSFAILLNAAQNTSGPLKIQLANVSETMDCIIEVISDTDDFSFSVLNDSSKIVSTSSQKDDFLNYRVASTILHLDDTTNLSFSLKFASKGLISLNIKRIILSFSDNKNYLFSPGKITILRKDTNAGCAQDNDDSLFSITGIESTIMATKKIVTTNNLITSSATISNIGETATRVFWGFALYTKNHVKLDLRHFPFNERCKVLKVISSVDGSDKIIVDNYSEWGKGCYLALNAKDDMSDIPNNTFPEGQIVEINKTDDGHAEITLSKPLKTALKQGASVRVHGYPALYLYTDAHVLKPKETRVFTSKIKKDDNYLKFASEAFPRGTYYVIPIILSFSVDSNEENTILINDFTVSY